MTSRHCCGVILCSMASRVMPALLTRMSTGPSCACTRATPSWQAAKSATFQTKDAMPVFVLKASAAAGSTSLTATR